MSDGMNGINNRVIKYARYETMIHLIKRNFLAGILGLLLAACSGPAVQPLMPTPVVFSELGFSPMEHIPEEERWTPRRVYYATTRQREDDLQRLDYGNLEGEKMSVGMTLGSCDARKRDRVPWPS